LFELTHCTGFAFENFDATGGAACISAAAVQDVDASIFEDEDEFLAVR